MSQTNTSLRCHGCGAEVTDGAVSCPVCGVKLNIEAVGAGIPKTGATPEYDEGAVFEGGRHLFSNRLVIRVALFLVSVVMLLLIFLVPTSRSYMSTEDGVEYSIDYTAVDSVKLAVYSYLSYGDSRLAETESYKRLLECSDELFILGSYANDEKRIPILEEAAECSLYVTLMSREVPLTFDVAVAAVASVLMIALAVIFAISAAYALTLEALRVLFDVRVRRDGRGLVMKTLWLSAAAVPLFGYAHAQLADFGMSKSLGSYSAGGGGLSVGFVFLSIVAAVGVIYSVLCFILPKLLKHGIKVTASTVKSAASALLALLMLILMLCPMVAVKLANPYYPKNTDTIGLSVGDIYYTTGDDIVYFASTSSTYNTNKINDTIKAHFTKNTEDDLPTDELLYDLMTGVRRRDNSGLYLALQIVMLINLVLVGLLLFTLGCRHLLSSKCEGMLKFLKITVMLLALTLAVLSIVIAIVADGAVTNELSYVMKVNVGVAPVLLILSAIALVASMGIKEVVYLDRDYDNPDVSYAPYVISARKKKRY